MKLNEIRYGEHFQCRIEPYSDKSSSIPNTKDGHRVSIGQISKDNRIPDAYILDMKGELKMVRITKCEEMPSLENRLSSGIPNLFEITDFLSNNSVDIEVVFFNGIKNIKDEFIINMTDELLDKDNPLSAKKNGIRGKTLADIGKAFESEFSIGSRDNPFYLFVGSSATINSFQSEEATLGDFSLVSKNRQLLIKSSEFKGETYCFAKGVKNRTPRNFDNSVCLLHGKIKFNDKGAETISRLNALEIENDLKDGSSYIGKWDQYNNLIGDRLLRTSRNVGFVVVSGKQLPIRDTHTLRFYFSETGNKGDIRELSADFDRVDIVQELPAYLNEYSMTYEEWIKEEVDKKLSQEDSLSKLSREEKELDKEKKLWSNLQIDSIGPDYIDIITKSSVKAGTVPKRGDNGDLFIVLSISGDKIQVERRRRARQNIVQGKSQISGLALILDGKGVSSLVVPGINRSQKKMSAKVQNKIFEHEPTINQSKAVSLALNSPDVTVIQGPPGTGKTTVICAIIESLNEEFQKGNKLAGKILVTSLQHDAVSNINRRLSVNSLPSIKFGHSGQEEDEYSLSNTEERIVQWSIIKASEIENSNPSIVSSADLRKVQNLFLDYHKSPSFEMEKNLLQGIKELPARFVTESILERIDSLLDDANNIENPFSNEQILTSLYALRTDEISFKDDGVSRALELADELKQNGQSLASCLEKACHWLTGDSLEFLEDLEDYKNQLLDEYLPSNEFRVRKENLAINQILEEVTERIQNNPLDPAEKKNAVLSNLVSELRTNLEGVWNTLLEYNPVFAATVQQVEGREISTSRKDMGLDSKETGETPYEYVIVDEAARVAPPDLMIPLAKGKHIILVGDQRQLPQQVDQEIERQLEEATANKEEISYLNESTFERLFEQLDVTKKITLDKQYRMHPLLGHFISDSFYKQYGESFDSPLGPEMFKHDLPFVSGKAAVWCDVPHDEGDYKEQKNSMKSRYRKAEARVAAKLLKQWLDTDTEKKKTFGVISFYSAQCSEVRHELSNLGICNKNGGFMDEYKYVESGDTSKENEFGEKIELKERIRIGTVDAFQGMEFDAVILCAVRSASEKNFINAYNNYLSDSEDGEKEQQRLFGFLMSKNRLCVSMSRQKKVLVVTGDRNLFTSEIAKVALPELNAFFDLCENNEFGKVIDAEDVINGVGA